jgi:hypothetical protein
LALQAHTLPLRLHPATSIRHNRALALQGHTIPLRLHPATSICHDLAMAVQENEFLLPAFYLPTTQISKHWIELAETEQEDGP